MLNYDCISSQVDSFGTTCSNENIKVSLNKWSGGVTNLQDPRLPIFT